VNIISLVVSGSTNFVLPTQALSVGSLYSVNEVVLAFYEAGQTPLFRMVTPAADVNAGASVTLTGYLVDLSL
jgi:hypothetical protein